MIRAYIYCTTSTTTTYTYIGHKDSFAVKRESSYQFKTSPFSVGDFLLFEASSGGGRKFAGIHLPYAHACRQRGHAVVRFSI